jgi:MoaA/NifB/PqqE/SkfB family radical SAM enzyme
MLKPYQVQVEVSSYCDLKCYGCMRNNDSSKKAFMEPELFYEILDKIDFPCVLTPWINGEPTMHKEFHKFAKKMNEKKQRYCLTSNASKWHDDIYQTITEKNSSCYQLIFSVDGLHEKTHDSIRNGSNLEIVKKHIERFLNLKNEKKSNIDFGIKIVDKGQDYEEIEEFIYYWLSYGIDFIARTRMYYPQIPFSIRRYPCRVFADKKGVLSIRQDGSLLLCAYNEIAINEPSTFVGNIKEFPTVIDAFNSDILNKIREDELKGIFVKPCSTCPIAYCGDGFVGLITFKDEKKRNKIPYIYWHSDSFQNFYSLIDTRNIRNFFTPNEK